MLDKMIAIVVFAIATVILVFTLCWLVNGDDDDYAC